MANSSVDATNTILHDSKTDGLEIKSLYENSILRLLSKPRKKSTQSSHLQDLQETKEKLEKELNEAKTALSASIQKVEESKEKYERLKKQIEEVTNHDEIINRKKAQLENELILLQKTKVNSHDEELVEKTKFQYKCLRNMTQVRFDYNKSDNDILEGYVFNRVTHKVTNFSINISKLDNDQVHERLMKLMKEASHPSYTGVPLE